MPTNKELLDAAAFHRRRLVAALLTGSSYDAVPRVGRPLVVGVLLAAAAAGGLLVAGYLGVRL